MARLVEKYRKEVIPQLIKTFGYKNALQAPRLEKIVLNMGLGQAIENPKLLEAATSELAQITGQKPVVTRARKSISAFKVREGAAIGAMVTLRKKNMYEFLDRLINIALPRVRDFKGVDPKSMDGKGNYTLGLKEQIIFPEIHFDNVIKPMGMNITFVTTAKNDDEARVLLKALGMPFRSV
ncbi:MAG: 50S ribosomal protein L5 [Deltaproteobacteria bacterium]|nr:50S ribosomal protein L5 [Deltaproteobacteria bacterium]